MLLDVVFDVVLAFVGSMIVFLLLIALPGLVLYVFHRGRVSRNEEDAPHSP